MGVIFEQADANVHQMASEIIERFHPELRPNGESFIRLCILLASHDSDKKGSAVKHDGYDCAAVISIIPYKQRVDKRADAEIVIDKDTWINELTEPQQRALLDHEITHLEILHDESGAIKTDDVGRPKLSLRNHDWQLGGFRSIAQRYGNDALEVIAARKFDEGYGDVALKADEKLFA